MNREKDIEDFLNKTLPTSITGVLHDPQKLSEEALQFDIPEITGANQTVSDILGDYKSINIISPTNLSEPYESLLYRDSNILRIIARDVQYLTKLKDECIQNIDKEFVTEISMVENLRVLSNGILKNSGMFYSESLPWILKEYPFLRNTTISSVVNTVYEDKHIYPICLPDGKVFTHMAYDTDSLLHKLGENEEDNLIKYDKATAPKYQISSQLWIQQDNLIANLESLSEYEGSCVYVVEGYFDAKRINDQWGKKSVALLSSRLSRNKIAILQKIKEQGHCLIYVPDTDDAGTNEKLIRNEIWDDVYYIPKVFKDPLKYKDIDNYVKFSYLDHYNLTESTLDITKSLLVTKLKIPFHEETLKEKITARRNKRS